MALTLSWHMCHTNKPSNFQPRDNFLLFLRLINVKNQQTRQRRHHPHRVIVIHDVYKYKYNGTALRPDEFINYFP